MASAMKINHERDFLQRISMELLRAYNDRIRTLKDSSSNGGESSNRKMYLEMEAMLSEHENTLDDIHAIENIEEMREATKNYCRTMQQYLAGDFMFADTKSQIFYEIAVED